MHRAAHHPASKTRPVEGVVRFSRLLIMLPAGVALIIGMLAGLSRMAVLPIDVAQVNAVHAPAMIYGFVASLISLERAVAIRRLWAFAAPLLLSVGSLILLVLDPRVGRAAILMGFLVFIAAYAVIWRRQPAVATIVQVIGALCGLVSVTVWLLGTPFVQSAPLAMMFLVLTIVGERIELGRVTGLTERRARVGLVLSTLVAASSIAILVSPTVGYTLLGTSLLVLVGWLFIVDIARSTISATGATRYMAVCLMFGYVWLSVAGAIWMTAGEPSGAMFDIGVHAVLLGFVMSMIMAHASVILPAVLRVKLPYRPWFYVPVLMLQVSLIVRVVGRVRDVEGLVSFGGIGNVLSIVVFMIAAVTSAVLAARVRLR